MSRPRLYRHHRIYTGQLDAAGTPKTLDGEGLLVGPRGVILRPDQVTGSAELVDLPGDAVLPGFIDTHAHLRSLGGSPTDLDLRSVMTPDQLLDRVARAAAEMPRGAWVTGTGWRDDSGWAAVMPGPATLDAASGGRPVALFRRDRHALLASASALRQAGIGPSTRDPVGGVIERDPGTGEPTGLLVDTAMDGVTRAIPPPTREQVAAEVSAKARWLASMGVTCVHEAWVDARLWEALCLLVERSQLPIRVRALLSGDWDDVPTSSRPDRLRAIGLKGFADGALGSRGAQLRAVYADAATRGIAVESDEALWERAQAAMTAGVQLAVHAIGDEGVRRVLDLFERCAGEDPVGFYRRARWRIEHAQMIHPDDMGRLEGVCLAVQPVHFEADAPWAIDRLGVERLSWSHRIASAMRAGAIVGFGSDYPIESGDPRAGLWVAESGSHPGVPSWPRESECVDRGEAYRSYWDRAAYLAFDEGRLGSLTPGHLADWVCLSPDPFEVDDPRRLEVVETRVGGERVARPSEPSSQGGVE